MKDAVSRPWPLWAIHGGMLISAALVATSFPVGKAIAPFLDPALLTCIRFILAALLLAPYVVRRFGLRLPDRFAIVRYIISHF